MRALYVLGGLAALSQVGADATFALHHRIYYPTIDKPLPFAPRGTLKLADPAATRATGGGGSLATALDASDSLESDLAAFASILEDPERKLEDALYQVALEREGDEGAGQWSVSSVKACHLLQAKSATMILHMSDHKPFALDYFVTPIPANAKCPSKSKSPKSGDASLRAALNTTIIVREPSRPPLPLLRNPPALSAQGEVVKPPEEKSFIQKYWVYIALGLVALLMAPDGGGSEEGDKGGKSR